MPDLLAEPIDMPDLLAEPMPMACHHQCIKCGILYSCKKIHGNCGMPFHYGKCFLCNKDILL